MALSVLPDPFSALAIIVGVDAGAGLLSADPLAIILASIFPDKLTFAVTLIFFKRANILFAVGPLKVTFAMHLVVQPGALVALLISPGISSLPLDLVHLELTFIH